MTSAPRNPATRSRNGNWKGNELTYAGAHSRVYRWRGRASAHVCPCGQPATTWAYDGEDPNEKIGTKNGTTVRFSCDPERYVPRCRSCHGKMDAPDACPAGHRGNFKESKRGDGSTFRVCRDCTRLRQYHKRRRSATMDTPAQQTRTPLS